MPKRPRPDKSKLKAEAEEAYKKQEVKHKLKAKDDRELKLLNDLQKKGTLSDKVSALMMKVQKSFVPEKFIDFNSLDSLFQIAKKKSRHHSYAALEGLQELFIDTLLPETPLRYINDLQIAKVPGGLSKLHLEDKLKAKYTEFIGILKSHTLDTVDYFKKSAIKILAGLLKKPEMQDFIIECIVNKLGDPSTAIPTSVILECNHTVWRNKQLMEPVLKQISRFLSRTDSTSASARFYSIVLLNSFKLTTADQTNIQLVIQILLRLFPIVVQETKTHGNKAVALLLKALNKNFPLFTNKSTHQSFFKDEIEEIYKLTHTHNTSIQIESLRFIFQSEQAQGFVSDRYYRSLYEFILPSPRLRIITYKSQALLFNTLMISLKEDLSISRIKAFIKRILQVCLLSEPPFILASLLMVSEVCKIHKSVFQLLENPSEDEEERYEDAPDSDEEQVKKVKKTKKTKSEQVKVESYDPMKREPKFAGAEGAAAFELGALIKHSHPTVRKWAEMIVNQVGIEYEGDPLLDFTLVNFLDRFEFRNPKKKLLNKLSETKVRMSLVKDAVNSKEFRQMEKDNVREEEVFFYKYFKLKPEKVEEASEEEEDESAGDEGLEDEFADFEDELQEFGEEDEGAPTKKQKFGVFVDSEEYYSKH